jgi:hypothetical protein
MYTLTLYCKYGFEYADSLSNVITGRLGGVVGSVLATGPNVAGSNSAEAMDF